MLAMQYSIPLPVGYDVAEIKKRVSVRKSFFDDHAGLVHKSFLYNDHDKLYAPFYIWKDVIEARNFLLDDLFKGVVETFNRHRVRSWFVLNMVYGNRKILPTFATRELDVIAPEENLARLLKRENDIQAEQAANPDLFMRVVALDPDRWEILHFSLWKDKASAGKPASDAHIDYDVLHVSTPEG